MTGTFLASRAGAQAFGRFGYVERLALSGFQIDRQGFQATSPAADRIGFFQPAKSWRPLALSEIEETVFLGELAGNPSKMRASLAQTGFSLYFPNGLKLRIGSIGAPYLTWKEGSASSGIPTPDVKWVVLSFRDAQPALVLGFPERPGNLTIKGKPGAWTLEGPKDFSGWVRIGLPNGVKPSPANSAAALGKLAQLAEAEEADWTRLPPVLKNVSLDADEDAVIATWSFDRAGALVPHAASFAPLGGYALQVQTPMRRLGYQLGGGPVDVSQSAEFKVRFPVRRVPTGRGLTLGGEASAPLGTASPMDIPSVAELALECLTSARDSQTRHSAEDTLAEYFSQATYQKEPFSNQLLPYAADGVGIELAAANALLMQALTSTTKATSEANSLFTSITWRRDWDSWLPAVADPAKARKAASLTAIAGAMCPEADRRLASAMFEAGLAAERGFALWQKHQGVSVGAAPVEPLFGIREELFRLRGYTPDASAQGFVQGMLSPIRLFGDTAVVLAERDKRLVLQWQVLEPKPSVLTLAAGYEVKLEPLLNLPRFRADQTLGMIEVRYTSETAGPCEARLTLPDWAKALPRSVSTPRYSETVPLPGRH